MKFSSAIEMLAYIQDGNDIWSPELDKYVFLYSELGSICYYSINFDKAKQLEILSQKSTPTEYWSSFLGVGGHICDSFDWYKELQELENDKDLRKISDEALTFCNDNFRFEWINCKDIFSIA